MPWYFRASLYNKLAESQAEILKAGDVLAVFGSLEFGAWETPEGKKNSTIKIKINRFEAVELDSRVTNHLLVDAKGGLRAKHGINEVSVLGNLTKDVGFQYVPTGDAVSQFSIAINESYKDLQGVQQQKTHYVEITAWRELAERIQDVKKGQPLLISGRLTNESWTDSAGNKRSQTRIEADKITVLRRGEVRSAAAKNSQKLVPSNAEHKPPVRPAAESKLPNVPINGAEFGAVKDLPF